VLVAFIGGLSLGSVYSRGGGSALGFGGGGGGSAGAAAPLKRTKSAASAGLRPSGKGAARRRRRAAAEAAGDEAEGEGAAAAAAPPEEKLGVVPPPPKPDGEPFSLSFYDGKSITVRSVIAGEAGSARSSASGSRRNARRRYGWPSSLCRRAQVYPHIDHGAGGNNWWNTVPGGWELDTLQAMRFFHEQAKVRECQMGGPAAGSGRFSRALTFFFHLLPPARALARPALRPPIMQAAGKRSIQIDFGCWVAPTALFAATYADQVFAVEPDPEAYREAWHNIELNPHLSPKIERRQLCISDKRGQLTLYGSKGDSMSSAFPDKNPAARYQYTSWNVECTTLDAFIAAENINPDEITLIKVDTEGHEAPIMWQMRSWLKAHPNIVISLSIHAFLYPDVADPATALMHTQLRDVIMDYKTVIFTHGDPIHRDGFSVGGWCRLCSLLLTNADTPAGYASWKDAFQGKKA
jgi:hypothetical protein